MTYNQAIDYLFSCLPIYQRQGKIAYKSDIGNIVSASKILNNPHEKYKSIHIAGTNGKGSVAHMIASILQEAGYKVGLYTSPHLKDFRERIKVNGNMIKKSDVACFVKKNKNRFKKIDLSFFEFTVALAFQYFAIKEIDIAIIETGLGGRLDSTNIIKPDLSIITNIGIDHTNLLGNTIKEISNEKAGIIKQKTPIIIGRKQKETKNIFSDIAKKRNAPLKYANNHKLSSDLKGNYQLENINTAVSAILEMQNQGWIITKKNIKKGLLNTIKNTKLIGRWHILSNKPLVICDTGHNEDALNAIFNQINNLSYNTLHIVFGIVNDKDLDKILKILPKDAIYYFCKANIIRALDAIELKKKASRYKLYGNNYSSVDSALKAAKRKALTADLIFIGGSTFVVSEII